MKMIVHIIKQRDCSNDDDEIFLYDYNASNGRNSYLKKMEWNQTLDFKLSRLSRRPLRHPNSSTGGRLAQALQKIYFKVFRKFNMDSVMVCGLL